MRQKRAKNYKKQMQSYHLNFKFREPYQVLVDHDLIIECVEHKYDLLKGLQRTLQTKEVKPMITQHSLQKLFDSKNEEAIQIGKTFERRRTLHFENSAETQEKKLKHNGQSAARKMHPSEAIYKSVVVDGSNVHRYVVATQDPSLRGRLRSIPGVPLIHMNRAIMLLEPFSPASERARQLIESSKLTSGLNAVKRKAPEGEEEVKKRKGPKAPNPLSVKKKKVSKEDEGKRERPQEKDEDAQPAKKVRRKRAKRKDGEEGESKADEGDEVPQLVKDTPKEEKEPKEAKETKEEAPKESNSEAKEDVPMDDE
ncbi:rRNA-processing protein [Yarrowia sp. B02]|nr:rRNA-processing protein [Yarrowia sp. B02]